MLVVLANRQSKQKSAQPLSCSLSNGLELEALGSLRGACKGGRKDAEHSVLLPQSTDKLQDLVSKATVQKVKHLLFHREVIHLWDLWQV